MKKVLCVFLIGILFSFVGCIPEEKTSTQNQTEQILTENPVVSTFQNNINYYDNPTMEFGETAGYFKSFGNMVVSIQYPDTGILLLDSYIDGWIRRTFVTFAEVADKIEEPIIPSYLSVTYDSYVVNDSIVSVRMKSYFSSVENQSPVVTMRSFNFDVENNEMLTVDTVFTEDTQKRFRSILGKKTDITIEEDDNLLKDWLLTDAGMEVALSRDGEIKTVEFNMVELFALVNKTFYLRMRTAWEEEQFAGITGSHITLQEMSETKEGQKPMIALTFDDGPSIYTEPLLDILDKHNIKGTFFVLGSSIDGGKEALKRMAASGHEIGSHSWEHVELTKLPAEEIARQVLLTRGKIFETVGKDCFVMRPPYGSYDEKLANVGKLYDVAFTNWSVDTLDWKSKDASAVVDEIMKATEDGSIILCHDLYPSTLEAVEIAIPKLLEKGYRFVTVSELMSHSKTPFKPGNLYYRKD